MKEKHRFFRLPDESMGTNSFLPPPFMVILV